MKRTKKELEIENAELRERVNKLEAMVEALVLGPKTATVPIPMPYPTPAAAPPVQPWLPAAPILREPGWHWTGARPNDGMFVICAGNVIPFARDLTEAERLRITGCVPAVLPNLVVGAPQRSPSGVVYASNSSH